NFLRQLDREHRQGARPHGRIPGFEESGVSRYVGYSSPQKSGERERTNLGNAELASWREEPAWTTGRSSWSSPARKFVCRKSIPPTRASTSPMKRLRRRSAHISSPWTSCRI